MWKHEHSHKFAQQRLEQSMLKNYQFAKVRTCIDWEIHSDDNSGFCLWSTHWLKQRNLFQYLIFKSKILIYSLNFNNMLWSFSVLVQFKNKSCLIFVDHLGFYDRISFNNEIEQMLRLHTFILTLHRLNVVNQTAKKLRNDIFLMQAVVNWRGKMKKKHLKTKDLGIVHFMPAKKQFKPKYRQL